VSVWEGGCEVLLGERVTTNVKWIGVLQTARGWFNSSQVRSGSMGAASGTGQLALMFALRFALDGGGFELGRVSS
jgi:hypothetical protein